MYDQEFILTELRKLPWATSLAAETQHALAEHIRVVEVPSDSELRASELRATHLLSVSLAK
jgi:predicted nucleic acid-binding protein